ncbi:MAG: 16S rRNA processing protein RimM [Alphaproteobacteria bacterium]|nr:16S rRNA processing protein RimM [Alphaproteobacteria bacterium]
MKDRVSIGKIVAAHGIKGEVKLRPESIGLVQLKKCPKAENKDATQKFEIKALGMAASNIRLKIKGIDDRNAAEAMVGTELFVQRSALPKLDEEEFYIADLVNLPVYLNSKDHKIGQVVGLLNFGAGEIIEIRLDGHKDTEMLPFTKEYVPTIDIDEGYVIVSSATMKFAEDDEE